MKIKSRIARALWEGFDVTKREAGEIRFRRTSMMEPHIKEIILAAAQKTGVPPDAILNKIRDQVREVTKMKKYSYLLFDTAAKMVIDQAAFDLVSHVDRPDIPKFSLPIFYELIDRIQLEHRGQFLPLRAPGELRYISKIKPILIPNPDPKLNKKFGSVNTAAASADGDFIFNVPFMQKLITYAYLEGLRPQGAKYEANGGDIPDYYAYIEFLIIHELLHYTYGDFKAGAKYRQYSPLEHNYASDYRSNYMLVKNGYSQLPLGLFSDHLNFDRQGSYKELIELVSSELKKLPKPLQDEFKDMAQMDEHPPPGGQPGDDKGEGKDSKQQKIQPGSIVKDKATGKYWKVTSVDGDQIDTVEATADEVAAATKKGGTP